MWLNMKKWNKAMDEKVIQKQILGVKLQKSARIKNIYN